MHAPIADQLLFFYRTYTSNHFSSTPKIKMAAIVRASSLQLVSHPLQLNISSRKSFAPVPVGPKRCGVVANATLRARNAVISAFSSSTVKTIIQGRNLSVTPAIKEYVESKVGKVSSHQHLAPPLGLLLFCHRLLIANDLVVCFCVEKAQPFPSLRIDP